MSVTIDRAIELLDLQEYDILQRMAMKKYEMTDDEKQKIKDDLAFVGICLQALREKRSR